MSVQFSAALYITCPRPADHVVAPNPRTASPPRMSFVCTADGETGVPRAARYTTGSAPSELLNTSKNVPGEAADTAWNAAAGAVVLMPMLPAGVW